MSESSSEAFSSGSSEDTDSLPVNLLSDSGSSGESVSTGSEGKDVSGDSSSGLDSSDAATSSGDSSTGDDESRSGVVSSETDSSSGGLDSGDESDSNVSSADDANSAKRNDKWPVSKNALLRGMMEGKASWDVIAPLLNRSREDCQARWKELKAGSGAAEPKQEIRPSPAPNKPKDQKKKKKSSTRHKKDKGAQDRGRSRRSRPINEVEAREEPSQPATATAKTTTSPVSNEDADADTTNHPLGTSFNQPLNPDPPSPPQDDDYDWEEDRQQRRCLYGTIYPQLYPPVCEIPPDDILDEEESFILSRVIDKMQRSRILELQANFFNATGKMVPLPILEEKYRAVAGDGEREMVEVKSERLHEWLR